MLGHPSPPTWPVEARWQVPGGRAPLWRLQLEPCVSRPIELRARDGSFCATRRPRARPRESRRRHDYPPRHWPSLCAGAREPGRLSKSNCTRCCSVRSSDQSRAERHSAKGGSRQSARPAHDPSTCLSAGAIRRSAVRTAAHTPDGCDPPRSAIAVPCRTATWTRYLRRVLRWARVQEALHLL